jgi:predicted ferric reductase
MRDAGTREVAVARRPSGREDRAVPDSLGAFARRLAPAAAVLLFLFANAAVIVWLWVHGGNISKLKQTGDVLTSGARLTGLLAAYLALIQVVLIARLPWLERTFGLDHLTVWHRWNGHACIDLVIAHVVLSVWGYALLDKLPVPQEISTMIIGGIYPGMITATIGTALLLAVVFTSIVIVRRRLRYEVWYAVHLMAYLGIALAWFHQIPTGNELVVDANAANYWRGLYVATIAVIVSFRLLMPIANAFRFRLRVQEVVSEGPGVVSLRLSGRRLDRLGIKAGQFFLFRFLGRGRWWASHPFSVSALPRNGAMRITVKDLGDFTSGLGAIRPGTRVVAEGPFGVFTDRARRRHKVLLVAGGIGITPVRALMEQVRGDAVVLYRFMHDDEVIFRTELDELAEQRGIELHYVAGDHATDDGAHLLDPDHLRELVPDLRDRDVYVCGPPGLADALLACLRDAGVPRRHIHAERFAL